jgi:GNAT superfamily N-acetyltransferase
LLRSGIIDLWIKFLSIDPEFQNRGYASQLAQEVFSFAKRFGVKLETSSYSDDGYEKLKGVFNRLASEHGVQFIDKGKINP